MSDQHCLDNTIESPMQLIYLMVPFFPSEDIGCNYSGFIIHLLLHNTKSFIERPDSLGYFVNFSFKILYPKKQTNDSTPKNLHTDSPKDEVFDLSQYL